MKAYVYTHTRLDTNEIFYVGIGTQDNYRRASRIYNRTNHWKNIAKKSGWRVDIVFDNLEWIDACLKEKELILKYGRIDLNSGTLVNLTDGGEGNFGRKATLKTRLKMSESKKGIPHSEENKKRTSEAMKGVNSKKVINTISGLVYNSVNEAAKSIGIDRTTLIKKLRGKAKNNTNLKYAD